VIEYQRKAPRRRGLKSKKSTKQSQRLSLVWFFYGGLGTARWRAERKKSPDAKPGLKVAASKRKR
jgi:hypothetical protein